MSTPSLRPSYDGVSWGRTFNLLLTTYFRIFNTYYFRCDGVSWRRTCIRGRQSYLTSARWAELGLAWGGAGRGRNLFYRTLERHYLLCARHYLLCARHYLLQVPDVYDCAVYDLAHNFEALGVDQTTPLPPLFHPSSTPLPPLFHPYPTPIPLLSHPPPDPSRQSPLPSSPPPTYYLLLTTYY